MMCKHDANLLKDFLILSKNGVTNGIFIDFYFVYYGTEISRIIRF